MNKEVIKQLNQSYGDRNSRYGRNRFGEGIPFNPRIVYGPEGWRKPTYQNTFTEPTEKLTQLVELHVAAD